MSSQDGAFSFLCRHCGNHSHTKAITTERWFERSADSHPNDPGLEYRYRLVRCTACLNLSLLIAMLVGWDGDSAVFDDDFAVFPAAPRYMSPAIPESLQSCFREARSCFDAGAFTAAAIMCRRVLELLARDRGVQANTLAKSIDKLKEAGVIDQRLFEWCTLLRIAGNEAAHEVGSGVSRMDARDLSDLAEAVIDYVYVFQSRYDKFVERRKSVSGG